jgi:hypothetical protein
MALSFFVPIQYAREAASAGLRAFFAAVSCGEFVAWCVAVVVHCVALVCRPLWFTP